jgi:hypothetical protein
MMQQSIERRHDKAQQVQMGMGVGELEILVHAHPHPERHAGDQNDKSGADENHVDAHLPLPRTSNPCHSSTIRAVKMPTAALAAVTCGALWIITKPLAHSRGTR